MQVNQVADLIERVSRGESPAESPAVENNTEMVSIEVVPVGTSSEVCSGAVVRLVRGEGGAGEVSLAAGLVPAQCRELSRQLLTIADAASRGTERTMMCVTSRAMWDLPGQVLVVRCTPEVHYEFVAKPRNNNAQLIRPPRKKLIR